MSNDTAPSTSRRSDLAFLTIVCAGFTSTALQSVYFRELLSVLSGNELSIGIILSVWLLATGASTALVAARPFRNILKLKAPSAALLVPLLCCAAPVGFFAIRFSRFVCGSGIVMGPATMTIVTGAAIVPFAVINGMLVGALFSSSTRPGRLYGWENVGAVLGALCVFACTLLYANNNLIAAVSVAPLLCIPGQRPRTAVSVLACAASLLLLNHASLQWKYPGIHGFIGIVSGREGEILPLTSGPDTSFLVNGSLYRSTMEEPQCEQAVHIPMMNAVHASRVLVLFDRGQSAQLAKYPGLVVDIVETEPVFAAGKPRARVAAVETLSPIHGYDAVFLGAGIPRTAAENRYFTQSFFRKIKSLLSDSGLLSFTLPFSENYLSRSERRLYDDMLSTLHSVWKSVVVFPGEGYTFIASDNPVSLPSTVHVPTSYLASYILPGVTEERIQSANHKPLRDEINTRNRPITLFLSLQTWLEQFTGGMMAFAFFLVASCLAVIVILPKTRDAVSIATSGFTAGVYSVCLLVLYQATFGSLYSRVSLIVMSLTAGFFLGSFVKRLPASNIVIGAYAAASLMALTFVPSPPAFLFYLFHAGIGVLTGAQFVQRCASRPAALYSADLLGGAIGMAVCSTLLVPLFGIITVAGGLFILKLTVEILDRMRRH